MNQPTDHPERTALFREHATAVLRGDRAEADRLGRRCRTEHHLVHHVHVFALFAACVTGEFGDDLDRAELARFVERLRADHPGVSPLHTEALIRVLYGEAHLYTEIPQAEQWAPMWTAARMIVGPDPDSADLAELYDRAEEDGRDLVSGAFESAALHGHRPEPEER